MLSSIRDLAPIILVILFFQLVVIQQALPNIGQLMMGILFVLLGLTFFVHGLEQGLFPIGESMAHAFARKGSVGWLIVFTVPLVTALGVGLATSIKGRNPMIDGFGLIAMASLTPIIFVMVYGMIQL